ncbi:MAG: tetratricopeptide repeat protein [Rhodospirillales bacterium]|nr:tetratricopeptide repeat protein [Rhodospirillales bacterium]
MKSQLLRRAVFLLAVASVGACGMTNNAEIFKEEFWASSPVKANAEAELGLAELGMGNYAVAEAHFQKALKADSKDVHALLGMGILYQNTGRTTKAREMYEAILAIRPDAAQQFVVWNTNNTRPISEIASLNLALLDSLGVTAGAQKTPSGVAGGSTANVAGAPEAAAMMGRAAPGAAVDAAAPGVPSAPVMSVLSEADANVVSRFRILRSLRDEGLITGEEYATRRQANLGALLPLTSPPPAAGLDRPVPSNEQVAGRLRAIGRALEMRAMTVSQHSAERGIILDALMAAAPVAVANPGRPPKGLMEAADAVRRLEALQAEGLVGSDEYSRERAAIERALQAMPAAKPVGQNGEADGAVTANKTAGTLAVGGSGPRPAVHLASYRSREAADRGWSQLKRAHKDLLEALSAEITAINLGPKGTFYRLNAGPLIDRNVAVDLCGKLKRRRQYCEPTFLSGG